MAREAGLDLVEVAPQDRPPVCRIMDYGKWKYLQKKKQKGRSAHEVHLKEIRLRPKTDLHDLAIKMERAREILERGDKVQFTMIFRGRERFHQDRGLEAFQGIIQELGDLVKVERPPRMEGRRMTMILTPVRRRPRPAQKPTSTPPDERRAEDKPPAEKPEEPKASEVSEGVAEPSAQSADVSDG